MNPRAFIAIIALLALIAAAWWQYGPTINFPSFSLPQLFSNSYKVEDGTSITTQDDGQLVADQQDVTTSLAQDFVNHYRRAVNDQDEDAANQARDLLSWRAQTVVDRDKTLAAGLKRLTRGLDAPRDIEISASRRVGDDFAEVKAIWIYPQERLERYFYIIIEDGVWKIDSLQSIPQ